MCSEAGQRKTVHIFNSFLNPYGGSELEALGLFEMLREAADVRLWATSSRASADLRARFPIERVSLARLALPGGGNFLFVGAHWRKGLWPYFARKPSRLIYVYNNLHRKLGKLTSTSPPGWPRVEYVFISDFQKRMLKLDGVVHPSPIDIREFVPARRAPGDRLVIGRLSRDIPSKFSAEDMPIFADLVRDGCSVRLQGATCIGEQLSGTGVEVLAAGHLPAARFLQDLDIFYYRTGSHLEVFGRVVFEAMACGLPVVCHSNGGYADWIRQGENGFLFDTSDEARRILVQLAADPDLRLRIGANARKTVEDMYSEGALAERAAFYLG